MSSTEVGPRVRELRRRHGVSLSTLSRTTGVGKATLSELERGRRNATLDTLYAITTALGEPLSAVLAEEASTADGPTICGTAVDATLVDRWVTPYGTTETYRIAVRRTRQVSAAHAPGVRETLTVLTGRIRTGPADHTAELGPGETRTYAADREHVYEGLAEHSLAHLTMHHPAGG